jgi:hypothetical protein
MLQRLFGKLMPGLVIFFPVVRSGSTMRVGKTADTKNEKRAGEIASPLLLRVRYRSL